MSKNIIVIICLIISFTTISAQASKRPVTVYLSAGISTPEAPSGFTKGWKNGFHGNIQIGLDAFPKTEFLFNIDFHSFNADFGDLKGYNGDTFRAVLFGGDLKLNFGLSEALVNPFIYTGFGLASISVSDLTTPTETITNNTINKVYFEVGGGIEIKKVFVRLKYISINTEYYSTAMLPISIGVKF